MAHSLVRFPPILGKINKFQARTSNDKTQGRGQDIIDEGVEHLRECSTNDQTLLLFNARNGKERTEEKVFSRSSEENEGA